MVNILIDRLPETVEIGDMEYPIRTDFRVSILFELLMQDDTVPDSEKNNASDKIIPSRTTRRYHRST